MQVAEKLLEYSEKKRKTQELFWKFSYDFFVFTLLRQ